jgi:hypothetical protein
MSHSHSQWLRATLATHVIEHRHSATALGALNSKVILF